ncbi:MAG TPA: molecular chaperone TorD family protein [Candidatus Binatia bacterium]|nr:molecular chaperone TorD family protein [Candidatus Binatia bacterium]
MPMIEIDPSQSPGALGAANRSRLYVLLADGFRFPSPEFHGLVQGGAYRNGLRAIAACLPYPLPLADESLATSSEYVDLQAEYIRLFDVGPKGRPPCTLYEGEYWSGARMQVMEELVRFYDHFGLSLSTEERELPDHLSVELEFLHYLTFKESAALERGLDPASYRRAASDFLARHPSRLLPRLRAKIDEQPAEPLFPALVTLADDFVRADLAYLRSLGTSSAAP